MQEAPTAFSEGLMKNDNGKESTLGIKHSHIVLIVMYALLMIASIIFLGIWIKERIQRYKKRNKWGYRSINSDTYSLTQSQLPTSPSVAKGSWIQIYHIFFMIGCFIRIFSLIVCILELTEDDESSGLKYAKANSFSSFSFDNKGNATPNSGKELLEKMDISLSFSGSYVFLVTFLIVLCCLAEVYHSAGESEMQQRVHFIQSLQARSGVSLKRLETPSSKTIVRIYRITNVMIIFMILLVLATFFMVFFNTSPEPSMKDPLIAIPQIFAVVLYIVFFFGFVIYGTLIFKRTYSLLKTFELKSNDSLKSSIHNAYIALSRIIFMVVITAVCFFVRAGFVLAQMILNRNISDDAWFIDFIYYAVLEWLPLVSTLTIFIIIPSREKKDDDISIIPIASY